MNEIILTTEEEQIYEGFYIRRKAEALGEFAALHDELAFAQDLLQAVVTDGLTPDREGGVSWFRRGGLDWRDPQAIDALQTAMGQSSGRRATGSSSQGEGGLRDMVIGLAVLLAVAVGGWWYLAGRQDGETAVVESEPDLASVVETPTEITPTPLPTLEADLLADIVDAAGVKTSLVVPRTLEVGGVSFVVQPVTINSGDWPLPDDERAVSWVHGTVVNYVLGLEATADNKTLLAALKPGDDLILRMSTGPAYRFAFADAVRVPPQASEIFRQTEPGLTLVLMGEQAQPTRVIIRAHYQHQSELETGLVNPAPTTTLGQSIHIDDLLQLTPLSARPIPNPATPAGYVTLALDVVLKNQTSRPLDTTQFQHHLQAAGAHFAAITIEGVSAWPNSLAARSAITATLTYAIPERVLQQGSSWVFAPNQQATPSAVVAIPGYSEPLTPRIELISAGMHKTLISSTVRIQSTFKPVVVEPEDLLIAGAQLDPLGSRLPWVIQAGEQATFPLWLRPEAQQMQITLYDQSFDLTLSP